MQSAKICAPTLQNAEDDAGVIHHPAKLRLAGSNLCLPISLSRSDRRTPLLPAGLLQLRRCEILRASTSASLSMRFDGRRARKHCRSASIRRYDIGIRNCMCVRYLAVNDRQISVCAIVEINMKFFTVPRESRYKSINIRKGNKSKKEILIIRM